MPKTVPIFTDEDGIWQSEDRLPLAEAAAHRQLVWEALARDHYRGREIPEKALPGVKSVGYWHIEHQQTWGLPWRRNEGIELTFLESGSLAFGVAGREYLLHPDDVTITRPWQRRRIGNPHVGAGRLHWLILDVGARRPHQPWTWPAWLLLSASDLEELTRILRQNERVVWKGNAALRRCVQALGESVRNHDAANSTAWIAVKINEFLLLALEMMREQSVSLDESLSSSLRTVELFLADLRSKAENLARDWTVQAMAATCGLGVTQFDHHVKRLTNSTPLRYLNDCRLEYAMTRLRRPGVTITQIAFECGFSSSQYFSTAFRRRFGRSPREFSGAATADL
jgi:AraC family L-rhamnose operon regulatory protein RhaS